MKKAILVGSVLILMLLLITSCGVPQEEYDKVSSDLAAAQTQIQSLQSELSEKEGELEAAQEKLAQGRARIEILNAIFIPAMTGELDRMAEMEAINLFLEWRDKIIDVEDPALTTKFEATIEAFSDEVLLSFFIYLLESTADALE